MFRFPIHNSVSDGSSRICFEVTLICASSDLRVTFSALANLIEGELA